MAQKWDFSGWATKANIRCSDGRTILDNAFAGNDGMIVPLVWNHQHNDPSEVLGHALLENRGNGVYAYGSFNNTDKGQEAKELVRHGDIKALSIYANQLMQSSKTPPCDVIHGNIREVSLVLAGANVGAYIDNVLMHGERVEDEAEIYHGSDDDEFYVYDDDYYDEVSHADEDKDETEGKESGKTVKEVLDTLSEEQKAAVGMLLDEIMSKKNSVKHSDDEDDEEEDEEEDEEDTDEESDEEDEDDEDDEEEEDDDDGDEAKHSDEDDDGETVGDVINTLTHKQRRVVEFLLSEAAADNNENAIDKSEEDDSDMKHNVFDNNDYAPVVDRETQKGIIQHAVESKMSLKAAIAEDLKTGGALAHAITDHNGDSVTYGIANIDYLFPDAKNLNNTPGMIQNEMDWVTKVINGTHHTPFSRVKMQFADITGEDARARGYVKGDQKVSEVIELLKREFSPQTIYKLQKLDRDDIIDITDFDVVAWLKAEMQIMLKAEIARAILIGDGRQPGSYKIKETCVASIMNDVDLFNIKVPVNVPANATADDISDAIIDAVILSRKNYKGSGNPSFFINEDYLGRMLLLKDGMGRRIYETEASLASALRVKELIPVDIMDSQTVTVSNTAYPLVGIIVNLTDYNVGTDKGGQTAFFDDFDLDFNKYEYLYETRMSGALVKPYSAMTVYVNQAS